MNNSLKGALLSGVVFPGLGQLVLKRYKRGIAFMAAACAGFLAIFGLTLQQSYVILEKIESAGGQVDLDTISNAAAAASSAPDSLVSKLALLLIAVCWLIGTVDAYRIGRKMDLAGKAGKKTGSS